MTIPPTAARDPLHALRRSARRLWVASLLTVLGVGVWAFRPVSVEPLQLESADTSAPERPSESRTAFNSGAFDAALWSPTTIPQAPEITERPAAPPLKLQLVGITRDTSIDGGEPVLRAALYDPDSDKLLIVAAGEKITVKGPHPQGSLTYTVAKLTGDAIDLSDGETTRTLSLKDERKP